MHSGDKLRVWRVPSDWVLYVSDGSGIGRVSQPYESADDKALWTNPSSPSRIETTE